MPTGKTMRIKINLPNTYYLIPGVLIAVACSLLFLFSFIQLGGFFAWLPLGQKHPLCNDLQDLVEN